MNKNVYMYDNLNRKKITIKTQTSASARPVTILSKRTWPKRAKSKKNNITKKNNKNKHWCAIGVPSFKRILRSFL